MDAQELPFEYISVQEVANATDAHGHVPALTDVCGFFLCQRGSADVSINDQTFHISRGDVYFYMPSTLVCLLSHSEDIEGIAVKCNLDFVLPMLRQTFDGGNVLVMREHPCISLTPEQQETIEQLATLVRERCRQFEDNPTGTHARQLLQQLVLQLAGSLFYELLFDYASNQSLSPQTHDNRDRIFQAFLASLFKNYRKERDVTFYATEQCLSPRYFSSIIKEKSGHSALQWIIQMVISSSRQMLRDTDLSIKEIATQFNFPSQSFFGKYFKQYVGVSPRDYRQQMRNQGSISLT